jgi:WD40 repeat protein
VNDDCAARHWDTATGEPRGVLEGHSGSVYSVVFSMGGQLVASGGLGDSTVRLWDAATGEPRGVLEGHSRWVSTGSLLAGRAAGGLRVRRQHGAAVGQVCSYRRASVDRYK